MKRNLVRVAPILALLAACRFLRSDFERIGETEGRIDASGSRRLVVRNNVGDVTVRAEAGAAVSARAVVYHRKEREGRTAGPGDLRVVVEGESVVVENAHLDESDHDDWKMDLRVSAPPGLDLEVKLGVGDCDVSGAFGGVEVKVGVGDLELKADALRGGRAQTGVGDLEVDVAGGAPTEDFACETGVGDLRVAVPAAFRGEVALKTGVGGIEVANAAGLRVSKGVVSASAEGRLGDGGVRLSVQTGTGDITFKRR